MQFQFDISSNAQPKPASAPQTSSGGPSPVDRMIELLHQLLESQRDQLNQVIELQREQLQHARSLQQEHMARWRNLMSRWEKDFPELPGFCKKIYPVMERAYLTMITNMVQELVDQGDEALDNDFALQDFVDRHGMRLGQFGHLLGLVGPLAEIGNSQTSEKPQ